MQNFDEQKVAALMTIAEIPFSRIHRVENPYWPQIAKYDDLRRTSPWFLIRTPYGLIEIGWRKNVMSINWSDTNARAILTDENVTKQPEYIHAWTYPKAVEYLMTLSAHFKTANGQSTASTSALA